MKRNIFCVWLAIAAVVFAFMSFGGCGGSSSTDEGSSDASDLSMSDVWNDDKAMDEIFDRLTSADLFKMFALRTEEVVREADGSITMQHSDVFRCIVSNEKYPKVPYIHQADQALVNTVRSDLGLSDEDADAFGQSGSLEVYGLARIKTDGIRNLFVYVVPRMGNIITSNDTSSSEPIIVSSDIDFTETVSEDETASDDNTEVVPEEYTMRDFQLDRWANFFRWMGNLAVEASKNYTFASSYQIQTADSEIADICDVQSRTFDFSYANVPADGPHADDKQHHSSTEFKRTRNNFVEVRVFAAHSFSDGNDYYLVESTTGTEPKNFADTFITVQGYVRQYLYGYTNQFGTEFHIDDGNMSDVELIYNAPEVRLITDTYNQKTSWQINGNQFGVKKNGASAKVDGGVSYPIANTWHVNKGSIENICMQDSSASAKWCLKMDAPTESYYITKTTPTDGYRKIKIPVDSTRPLEYNNRFLWKIGRDYWKNNPDMKMNLTFTVKDGCSLSGSIDGWHVEVFKPHDSTCTTTTQASLKLEQPPHIIVDKTDFEFTSYEAASQPFTILASGFQMSINAEWVDITTNNYRGGAELPMLVKVSENPTNSPRETTITLRSGCDTVNLTVWQAGK